MSQTQLPHSSHPALPQLVLLVFEAVLEVVCVSLPGYIIARMGMFDAEMQKFVANLNVSLFTPCLSRFFFFHSHTRAIGTNRV
jgi:auxin efflux carrier family protein